jgi:putative Mn2+ efflux pump MntP
MSVFLPVIISWLGIWFLVQTFEGETEKEKDAEQEIIEIRKLLDESDENNVEDVTC